jgi:hypothetical protein
MSFDYTHPQNSSWQSLPRLVARTTGALGQRLKPSVTQSKLYERRKPSARRWRSVTSASTAPKSSASTKRCPSLTDRAPAPVRKEADGAPSSRKSQGKVPAAPLSKNRVNPRALAMTLTGVVKRWRFWVPEGSLRSQPGRLSQFVA